MPAASIVEDQSTMNAAKISPAPTDLSETDLSETDLPKDAAGGVPTVSAAGLRRLVLTGFMGAGKSTVGPVVARRMGWRFIDVDLEIERRAGMPVAKIFATQGEFVFRRMETSAIAHALGERDAVIALGGGAPEVLANRLLLEQTPNTVVILLEAPLEMLLERCHAQARFDDGMEQGAAVRPVLQNAAAAEERFVYRAPLYRRIARRTVSTAGRTVEEAAIAVLAAAGLGGES